LLNYLLFIDETKKRIGEKNPKSILSSPKIKAIASCLQRNPSNPRFMALSNGIQEFQTNKVEDSFDPSLSSQEISQKTSPELSPLLHQNPEILPSISRFHSLSDSQIEDTKDPESDQRGSS